MEKKVSNIYKRASNEISYKWDKYMKSHEGKVKSAYDDLQEALKSGDKDAIKSAKEIYERVIRNVTLNDSKFRAMVKETTAKLANTNEVALNYVNDNMAKVYTLNYNEFGNQDISGYTFTLVNEQAVKNLAKEDKSLLLAKKLDIPKDKAWNTKSINAEVLQGILQGENIPKIAKRLQNVTDMNNKSAIRNARTMVTSAENKGRQDSFKKAESDGVIMKRRWVAAHDDRTRASHIELDGQEVGVDEPFVSMYGEILYPGDPDGDPCDVYNCRCSIRSIVKGFKWNTKEEEEEKSMSINFTGSMVDKTKPEVKEMIGNVSSDMGKIFMVLSDEPVDVELVKAYEVSGALGEGYLDRILLNAKWFNGETDGYGAQIVAHELFHTVQSRTFRVLKANGISSTGKTNVDDELFGKALFEASKKLNMKEKDIQKTLANLYGGGGHSRYGNDSAEMGATAIEHWYRSKIGKAGDTTATTVGESLIEVYRKSVSGLHYIKGSKR